MSKIKLLSHGSTNYKTAKNQHITESYILYLSPYKQNSFGKNVCGNATKGCIESCLYTAGRGAFSNVQKARQRRTDFFFSDMPGFLTQLYKELYLINAEAMLENRAVAIRLNGTSDLDFFSLFNIKDITTDSLSRFPNLVFYDYTKNLKRALKYLGTNYHLTFSKSESNKEECVAYLKQGGNVAMVFDKIPDMWWGYEVVNGDESDLRYMDRQNVIIGLKAKGKARKDTSGFVIKTYE